MASTIAGILAVLAGASKLVEPVARVLQRLSRRRHASYEMTILRFNEHLYRYFGTYFFAVCTAESRYLDMKSRNSRIALNKVFDTLSHSGGPRVVLLWSEGGMGKTALASHIIRTAYLREKWFNVLLGGSAKQQAFVDGELKTFGGAVLTYSSLLDVMGEQFGVSSMRSIGSIDEKLRFLQRKLRNQRALIVIDNLETLANTQEIVDGTSALVASTRGSRVLVTTRDGRVGGHDVLSILLHPMTQEEGLEFAQWYVNTRGLVERSAVEFTEDLMRRIVKQTGGSPLAIEQLLSQVSVIGASAIARMQQVGNEWQRFYDFLFSSSMETLGPEARMILWNISTLHRPSTYEDLQDVAERQGFASVLDTVMKTLVGLDLVKTGRLLPDILGTSPRIPVRRLGMALYSVSPVLTNYVLRHKAQFTAD